MYTFQHWWWFSISAICQFNRHRDAGFWTEQQQAGQVLYSLIQKMWHSCFPRRISNSDSSDHSFPPRIGPFYMNFALQCFWIVVTYGFFFAWQSFNMHSPITRTCSQNHSKSMIMFLIRQSRHKPGNCTFFFFSNVETETITACDELQFTQLLLM